MDVQFSWMGSLVSRDSGTNVLGPSQAHSSESASVLHNSEAVQTSVQTKQLLSGSCWNTDTDSGGLGGDSRFFISNKFWGMLTSVGAWSTLGRAGA